ncbi:MAG: hypothetical protein ABSA62_11025, partial [Methyloceanibacter sp.]
TPFAMSPLRRQNPREEPGALAAHAGIGAGGEEQSSYRNNQDNDGFQLVFGAPCQVRLLAGQEHGRTIPLPDIQRFLR